MGLWNSNIGCYCVVGHTASNLPQDKRLGLPVTHGPEAADLPKDKFPSFSVGHDPGAGAGRESGEYQVKGRRQLVSLHLLRLEVLGDIARAVSVSPF